MRIARPARIVKDNEIIWPGAATGNLLERPLYRPMFEDDCLGTLESANIFFSFEIDPTVVGDASW